MAGAASGIRREQSGINKALEVGVGHLSDEEGAGAADLTDDGGVCEYG